MRARLLKGKRSKEICLIYIEKGHLLWWQIIKHATREHIINNLYVHIMNIHEYKLLKWDSIYMATEGTHPLTVKLFTPCFLDVFCLMISILWYNYFDFTWHVGHTSSLKKVLCLVLWSHLGRSGWCVEFGNGCLLQL